MKVEYRTDGSLGWIILSNPPYNNLIHPVFADWTELTEFLASPDLKAVIIKGEGRHFCGGADLDILQAQMENPDVIADAINQGKSLLKAMAFAPIPLLAMVKGSCLGGGLEIALACHFRFASENAMFGFPEAENALMPAFGGSVFTNNVVPRQSLIDLMLSGRMVRSNEALAIGLIDRVLPTSKLETAAAEFLGSLTDKRSPTLIRSVMESIHNGKRLSMDEALRRETELFCRVVRDSHDNAQIHSHLERVPITDVERDRRRLAADCFSDREIEELASRRTATMAGFLAVKKALVSLFVEAGGHGDSGTYVSD